MILMVPGLSWAIQIMQPTRGQVWDANTQVQIRWDPQNSPPDIPIDVDLLVGLGDGVVVMEISNNVPSAEGQTSWTVSKFLSSRSDYFVRLSDSGSQQTLSSSERFKISSPDPLVDMQAGSTSTSMGSSLLATGSRIAALLPLIFTLLFLST